MATPAYNTSNNSLTYYFDFSPFDDGYYELTFTFVSGQNCLDPAEAANIHITNFGSANVYSSLFYNTQASTSQHVGLIWPSMSSTITGHGFYHAGPMDNSPVIIRRPNTNNFTVNVYTYSGALFMDGNTPPANLADYLLILNFKKIADV